MSFLDCCKRAIFSAFFLVVPEVCAFSDEQSAMIDLYLEVETAYISKNIPFLADVLREDFSFTSIVYVEDKLLTSRVQTKEDLLSRMFDTLDMKNNSGLSLRENVKIIKNEGGGFCGSSVVKSPVSLKREEYNEVEEREICFARVGEGYKAIGQRLEFFYRVIQ